MPVFDVAGHIQPLHGPGVLNPYYEGEIARGQIAAQKLEPKKLELREREVEVAEKRNELSEQEVELKKQQVDLAIDEWEAVSGRESVLDVSDRVLAIGQAAVNTEDPIGYANARLPDVFSSLPDGETKDALQQMASDGVLTEAELTEIYSIAGRVQTRYKGQSGTVATAKMKEAASLGYQPGTKEYEDYLRGDRKPSINDIVVPILRKLSRGEELTKGEQAAMDIYTRASLEEKLLAALLGDISAFTTKQVVEEAEASGGIRQISKEETIKQLLLNVTAPAGEERDKQLDDFLSVLNEFTDADLTKKEATTLLDLYSGRNVVYGGSGEISGPIER